VLDCGNQENPDALSPFPIVSSNPQGEYFLNHDRPHSIGKVKSFPRKLWTLVRALCYILANGRRTSRGEFGCCAQRNYLSTSSGITTISLRRTCAARSRILKQEASSPAYFRHDIAKRLMDYGFIRNRGISSHCARRVISSHRNRRRKNSTCLLMR